MKELLQQAVQQLMWIAAGGLLGALSTIACFYVRPINRLPWLAQARNRRFFGELDLAKGAMNVEKIRRQTYGIHVITTLADLGGPGPWPRSAKATRGVLEEAERRFRVSEPDRGLRS